MVASSKLLTQCLQEVDHFAMRLPPGFDLKLLDMFPWFGWKGMPLAGLSMSDDIASCYTAYDLLFPNMAG